MKHIKLLFLLILFSGLGFGQTTLSAGDIVINGVISDNADVFSFVLLRDVENGTQINFADKGWFASGSFRNNEGIVTWTANSYLTCGTEVIVTETALGSNVYNVNYGSATETDFGFALATAGDQITAFQGTQASPTILYAIFFGSNVGWTDATDNNTSALPTGLTDGVNAIYIGNFDNGNYGCSVTSGSAPILAAVSTSTNWTTSNNRTLITIGGCSYTCVSCSNDVIWTGTWDNGTGPTASDNAILSANYITSLASFTACSLQIDTNVDLTITPGTYVEIYNHVSNNGRILIQDEGSFVQVSNTSTYDDSGSSFFATDNTSQVTRETAPINNWFEYTYWSSPVANETVEDALFTANPDRRFVFNAANFEDSTYEVGNNNSATAYLAGDTLDDIDDDGNDWQYASGLMTPGVGYAATLSTTSFSFGTPGDSFAHIFEGTLNNGNINVPVVRNDGSNSSSAVPDNNWNFIGNPYPSAIDVDLFFLTNQWSITNTTATLDGSIYLWSQNTAPSDTNNGNQNVNFSGADYAVINGMGESAGGDGITPSRHISSGQGFFVRFVEDDLRTSSTGNVVFNNAMRVRANNTQFFRTSNVSNSSNDEDDEDLIQIEKLRLNLTSDNGVFNQILIGYHTNATNDFDGAYFDASKNLSTNTYVSLGSLIENNPNLFAIQGRAISSLGLDEIVKLAFLTNIDVPTIYTISINNIEGDFLNNNTIYLKDNLLSTIHDLSSSDYNFTSSAGTFNDRFEVVFNNASLSTNDFALNENNLAIIELDNDNVLFKTGSDLTIKSIKIF
ncbi:MAG: hypothetical protein WBF67_04205, partial [Olleya sp.]